MSVQLSSDSVWGCVSMCVECLVSLGTSGFLLLLLLLDAVVVLGIVKVVSGLRLSMPEKVKFS